MHALVGRGLLEGSEAREMLAYRHSGFSVDTSLCIQAQGRAGPERLLRYVARPPFVLDRLRKEGSELIYRCAKQHSVPGSVHPNKRSAKGKAADELHLTPLELIERLAALVPPPRAHRHRFYGVLTPISTQRTAATALAAAQAAGTVEAGAPQSRPGGAPATGDVMGVATARRAYQALARAARTVSADFGRR